MEPDREPRMVDLKEIHVAGMTQTCPVGGADDVPRLWREFRPRHGEIAGVLPHVAFGVCIPFPKAGGPRRFECVTAV